MLTLDYTLFIQIANFLILLFVLNIILYRPIRKILGQRRQELDGYAEKIRDYQSRSEESALELEQNAVTARKEGHREKEEFRKDGLEQEKAMVQEAMSKAAGKIDQAKKEIDRMILDARGSLEEEVSRFSREVAENFQNAHRPLSLFQTVLLHNQDDSGQLFFSDGELHLHRFFYPAAGIGSDQSWQPHAKSFPPAFQDHLSWLNSKPPELLRQHG